MKIRRLSRPMIAVLMACVGSITLIQVIIQAVRLFRIQKAEYACNALWSSAESGNKHVKQMLDQGTDPNCMNGEPLRMACLNDHVDTARLLLARGADPNLADSDGDTPLKLANAEVTKILLDHGANIEAVDYQQRTALIWAVMTSDPDEVRVLLEYGAKVGAKDYEGNTALDYAMYAMKYYTLPNDRQIAALLRKYGAK